jgi:hypothetical protein
MDSDENLLPLTLLLDQAIRSMYDGSFASLNSVRPLIPAASLFANDFLDRRAFSMDPLPTNTFMLPAVLAMYGWKHGE